MSSDFRQASGGGEGGIETWAGDSDERVEVVRRQDVEPILDANKRSYADPGRGYSPSRDLQRVASIPLIVVEAWLKEGIDIFDPGAAEEVRRRLNDPQWRHLRVSAGRV